MASTTMFLVTRVVTRGRSVSVHRSYLACRPSRTSRSGQFTLLSQAEQSFGEALDGARQTSMVHALLEARGDESTW